MRLLEMQLTRFLHQSAKRGLVGKIFEKGVQPWQIQLQCLDLAHPCACRPCDSSLGTGELKIKQAKQKARLTPRKMRKLPTII